MIPVFLSLTAAAEVPDKVLEAHVLSVLTSNEFGSSRRRTVRWAHSPTVAIIGGSDAHRQLAEDTAEAISAAIAPLALTVITDPDAADIRLYFDDLAALTEIASQEGFLYVPGNAGLFWCWWDARGRLSRSVILIQDRWEADSAFMRHLVLEEMTQSMGLMNDSDRFAESVFYETPTHSGTATALGPLDTQTIALLYSLRPGTRKWRLRRAFRRRW